MVDCNTKGLYVQGIYSFEFYDIATDALLFQSRYVTESSITTSTNLNAIKGGIGNATLIQIPSDAELKVAMTAQNFTLDGLALNTGSTIMPNGIYRVQDEVILDAEGKGKVKSTPYSALGSRTEDIVGYVNCSQKVTIDPETKEFRVEGGKEGDRVCIAYFTQSANAEMFIIGSNFSPKIGRAVLRTPIYSSDGDSNANEGIKVGELQIVIPRAQLDGNLNIDLSQTSNATTVLNMTALVDYSVAHGECPKDGGTLGYIVQVLYTNSIWDSIDKLVVVDCGVTVAVGESEKLVIKGYDLATDSLVNIPYEDLTFTSLHTDIATVDKNGLVTGVAAGEAVVTVELMDGDGAVVLSKEAKVTVVGDGQTTPSIEFKDAEKIDASGIAPTDNPGIAENMDKYTVTKNGNKITIKDEGLVPYVGGNSPDPKKWVGILVDLGVKVLGSSKYTIEPEDYADAARWGATNDTTFVMWLTPEKDGTFTFRNAENTSETFNLEIEFTA